MPDPTRQSVSASQAAAMFDQSPYLSRFALYHHFKSGAPVEAKDNERMQWGRSLERVIVEATAEQYRLDYHHNAKAEYVRRGKLGCTIDAFLKAPDAGRHIVQAKNVDWLQWKEKWTETAAPLHIEIQTQTELYANPDASKGIISCFVGGNDMHYYERTPDPAVFKQLEDAAETFFDDLKNSREPDAIGMPVELAVLAHLYPESDPTRVIEALDYALLGDLLRQYGYAKEQKGFYEKLGEQLKAKVLARAEDAVRVIGPGARASIRRSPVKELQGVRPDLVKLASDALQFLEVDAGMAPAVVALRAALAKPYITTRKAYIQTVIDVDLDDKPVADAKPKDKPKMLDEIVP